MVYYSYPSIKTTLIYLNYTIIHEATFAKKDALCPEVRIFKPRRLLGKRGNPENDLP
jgi:hypothetical protein